MLELILTAAISADDRQSSAHHRYSVVAGYLAKYYTSPFPLASPEAKQVLLPICEAALWNGATAPVHVENNIALFNNFCLSPSPRLSKIPLLKPSTTGWAANQTVRKYIWHQLMLVATPEGPESSVLKVSPVMASQFVHAIIAGINTGAIDAAFVEDVAKHDVAQPKEGEVKVMRRRPVPRAATTVLGERLWYLQHNSPVVQKRLIN